MPTIAMPHVSLLVLIPALIGTASAQELRRSDPSSPEKPFDQIWTRTPVRVDRDKDTRERLPPRGGPTSGELRLVVDPFPQLDAESTFTAQGRRWRIAHVALPARSLFCPYDHGRRWPCGVRAWAFVSGLLAGARLNCDPPSQSEEAIPVIDCRLDDGSVAERIIRAGWGTPRSGAPPHLFDVYRHAVEVHRGLGALAPPP